jgi:hypothetical protein
VIDLLNEQTMGLGEAARRLPRGRRGRPVTLSCLVRWVLEGVKSPAGEVVKLEAVRLGGRWVTSAEALQRFAERLTPNTGDGKAQALAKTPRPPTKRQKASERAAAELEKAGI